MKVWVYVEGPADRSGLDALWENWRQRLKQRHWGIQVIPLDDKNRFFRKIGAHAAEKLLADSYDLVVGLPDYYPNQPYIGTKYQHGTLEELLDLQRKLVKDNLIQKGVDSNILTQRFYPSALKHDLEMLLLAACDQLQDHLNTQSKLGRWRYPVEDQNQTQPPKRIVADLYLTMRGRAYRDTKDAPAVLGKVKDLKAIIQTQSGQVQCPVFKEMLDWIGSKTGVPAY
jgi:hypothetical protein